MSTRSSRARPNYPTYMVACPGLYITPVQDEAMETAALSRTGQVLKAIQRDYKVAHISLSEKGGPSERTLVGVSYQPSSVPKTSDKQAKLAARIVKALVRALQAAYGKIHPEDIRELSAHFRSMLTKTLHEDSETPAFSGQWDGYRFDARVAVFRVKLSCAQAQSIFKAIQKSPNA